MKSQGGPHADKMCGIHWDALIQGIKKYFNNTVKAL